MSDAERLACELDAVPENGADPQLIADAAAHLRRLDMVEGDYQRLLEKHNNLHMNHMRLQAECEQLRKALGQAVSAHELGVLLSGEGTRQLRAAMKETK